MTEQELHNIRRIYETQVEHNFREIVLARGMFEELFQQAERGQQWELVAHDRYNDWAKSQEEIKRLREALEEIEDSSAGDFDGVRQIARQALEGESK